MTLVVLLMLAVEVLAICGALVMLIRCLRINSQIKPFVDDAGTITGVMRVIPFGVLVASITNPSRYVPSEAAHLVSVQRRNGLLAITFCALGVAAGVGLDALTYSPDNLDFEPGVFVPIEHSECSKVATNYLTEELGWQASEYRLVVNRIDGNLTGFQAIHRDDLIAARAGIAGGGKSLLLQVRCSDGEMVAVLGYQ